MPRVRGPPITPDWCHCRCVASGTDRKPGKNNTMWPRKAGCGIFSNIVTDISVEPLVVMHVQLLDQLGRVDGVNSLSGALRTLTANVPDHINRAGRQAIRPCDLRQVGRGGRREPCQEPAQDVPLRLGPRPTGARLDKLPRPA